MKVVLFCGGLGMRMQGADPSLPKPMIPIGERPVLWHVMRYYAHFGHKDFILCLGHGAKSVKDYFLSYHETASNDFVFRQGGARIDLMSTDISDWTIHFVDTGANTSIGERLRRVRPYLADDDVFLANYGDVLTDAPLNDHIDDFVASGAYAQVLAVPPQESFHVLSINDADQVTEFTGASDMPWRINGGYMALRSEIFDYLGKDEDLVGDAYVRAAKVGKVRAASYDGFWACMDTLKERAALEDLWRRGNTPWTLWRGDRHHHPHEVVSVPTPVSVLS